MQFITNVKDSLVESSSKTKALMAVLAVLGIAGIAAWIYQLISG